MKYHENTKSKIIDQLTFIKPYGNYNRRFGVYFKHNTGRAVAYMHELNSEAVTDFQYLEKWLNESLTPSFLESLNSNVKETQFFNNNGLCTSKLTEWDVPMQIGDINVHKMIRVRHRSTVVFMNTEFYFLCST